MHPERSGIRTLCRKCQRVLHYFFAGLFALVMPFICLGAFAEPGHPHRFPHFVFVDPVLAMPEMMQMAPPQDSQAHSQHVQHAQANDAQAVKQPVGRATSSLVLSSILLLIGLTAWLLSRIDQDHHLQLQSHPFPESVSLAILLPPPRSAVSR